MFVQGRAKNVVLVHVSLALEGKFAHCYVIYNFSCKCDDLVYVVGVARC